MTEESEDQTVAYLTTTCQVWVVYNNLPELTLSGRRETNY